jgi:hypothetical protein
MVKENERIGSPPPLLDPQIERCCCLEKFMHQRSTLGEGYILVPVFNSTFDLAKAEDSNTTFFLVEWWVGGGASRPLFPDADTRDIFLDHLFEVILEHLLRESARVCN